MESSRMASSPPQSASLDVPPSSPDQSRYVLNIDALGSESGFSSPSSDHTEPLITSDDIGGPSDFTLRMMDYMTGKLPIKPKEPKTKDEILTGTPDMRQKPLQHLQPTVEDYNSEISPSRGANTPTPSPLPQRTPSGIFGQNSIPSPNQTQGGASAYLRSQTNRLNNDLAAEKRMRAGEKAAYAEEMERRSEQNKQQLEAAAAELRTLRATHEAEMQRTFAQHKQELQAVSADLHGTNTTHKSNMEDMKASFVAQTKAVFEQERQDHAAELECMKAQHVKHLQTAAEEIEQLKSVRNQGADGYEEETKRIKEQHLEDMRATIRHTQALKDSHAQELEQAKSQAARYLEDMEAGIKQNEALQAAHAKELERLRAQIAQLVASRDAANSHAGNLEATHAKEIEQLKEQNAQLLASKNTALRHANELEVAHAEETDRLIRDLEASTKEARALKTSHAQDLERALKHAASTQTASLESAHAAELSRLQSDLAAATAETTGLTKELRRASSKHTRQLQSASDEIDELRAANKEHMDRLLATLEEKLTELEVLKAAHAQTERMNKALGKEVMRAWGREEFGDTGEKQKYRYKHVRV